MSRRRRVAAALAALVAAVLALLALGWFPQEPVRRAVEARLRALAGPGSRVGRVRVVPGRLSAEVTGLVLDAPGYRLEADRATVVLSPATLWGGGLLLERLEMDGGTITLRTPAEPAPATEPFRGPVVVRSLSIRNATVRWVDPAGDVVLRDVDVRGGLGSGTLEVRASGGLWQRARPVEIGPAHARLRISPSLDLQVEALEAGLPRSRVRVTGSLGRLGALRPDLAFEVTAELAELEPLSGVAATGQIEGEGRVSGTVESPRVQARLRGERLRSGAWSVETLRGDVVHEGAGGTRATLDVALLGGTGRVQADLRGTALTGRARFSRIDVRRIPAAAERGGLAGAVSGEVGFEGVLGDPIDLRWDVVLETTPGRGVQPLPPGNLTARGRLRGADVSGHVAGTVTLTGPGGPLPMRIEGDVRSAQGIVTSDLTLGGLGGDLRARVRMRGEVVESLEASGESLELGRLDPRVAGRAHVVARLSGPPSALSGTVDVRVDDAAWDGFRVGPVRADVRMARGVADVALDVPQLHATANARVPRGPAPVVHADVRLDAMPLEVVRPLMPAEQVLDGVVSATATLAVPMAAPERATAQARVERLEVSRGELSARAARPFELGYADRRVEVRGLSVEGEGLRLDADGTAALDLAGPLALHVSGEADLQALPAGEGRRAAGVARLDVQLRGTRAAPLAEGFLDVGDATLEGEGLPAVRITQGRIVLDGRTLLVPAFTATVAGGEVRAEGRVPIAAAWPAARRRPGPPADDESARIGVEWSGIAASALRPGAAGADVQAELQGRAEIAGGFASLEEVRVTATMPATTGRVRDLPFELAPARVDLENGRATLEMALQAAGGRLGVAGAVHLPRRELDLTGRGTLDLRALSAFLEDTALTGTADVDVALKGTFDVPRPSGSLHVRDGTLRLRTIPQALTALRAEVVLEDGALRLVSGSAALGGGTLSMQGQARIEGAGVADASFTLSGRDLAVRYPEGLRSRLEADLTLAGRTGAFKLAGTVRALRGLYDLDIALEDSLTAPTPETVDSPLLRSVAVDILVTTESPVLVRNSFARLQATGRLTVRGDLQAPAPVGTLAIETGGKLYLQGREFVIQSGRLVYAGTWDPELSLEATTRIGDVSQQTGIKRADVLVTVVLEGNTEDPRISLRSDPSYSRLEILSLIATGDSQGSGMGRAVGGSAAALLAGRITRGLGGLGLDEVSIQPELVAKQGEVETGARFTFGKRLSRRVNLVYSLSLQDPESRFVQLVVTPGRQITTEVRLNEEGTFTYGAGQRFHFGGRGATEAGTDERVRIAEVQVEGDQPLEPAAMRELVGTKPGDRRSVWDLQDAAEEAREELVERGYLEAEVAVRLDGQVAVFAVHTGPRYRWRVEGLPSPPDLTKTIRSALFEEEALEKGRARLLEGLRGDGHLRAEVDARAVPEGDGRTLLFQVRPGPVLEGDVSVPGAQALSPGRLRKAIGGPGRALAEPDAAIEDVLAEYRRAHYLAAEAGPATVEDSPDGRRVRVVIPVREGPRARVGAVRFEGATRPEDELRLAAELPAGSAYDEDDALAAADRLRAHYFGLGHPAVRVSPSATVRGADLEVVFAIVEGERVTVKEVVLTGLRRTNASLVRRQVTLRPGDPLDPRKVAELERRLLDLGLFSRAAATISDDNPATVTVVLEEGERASAGYLFTYNDDKGSRGELDGELRHLARVGLSAGGRASLGPDIRDGRGFIHVPPLFPPGKLTVSGFRLAEDLPLDPAQPEGETFERVQVGAQLQATRRFGDRWDVLWGYRFKRTTIVSPFATISLKVAALDVSLVRDTRDNPIDARRGRFWSLSLELAPKKLGSDFDFVKGYAQAFVSRPLGPTFTWAQGLRLGLAHPFGGEPLVSDEGFEAGGANSIRGFDPGEVGPVDYRFGREGVLVVNEELRYHHPSGLGGVVFYDAGNTFATAEDFSLDLRHVLGAGVRWRSPVGLLRVDLGRPLGRLREGESRYKLFFSFGQAF